MFRQILLTLTFTISFITLQAQNTSSLYKGTVNGKMPVTLFLQSVENGCGGDPYYNGMYRYEKVSNWLQLNVTEGINQQFAMVEEGFTGLMILKKEGETMNGTWISPDGKKQIPVQLKKVSIGKKDMESYEKRMEQLNYENHDC
ncbi:Uncharacterised protein [Chryseobacterium nakagawai]|uniref:GLPGLI family protein n=1 Tax=Chryseobacterium nakagawai TaxID=1241982 RepID=A0AAD0YT28_CHRNA|nr:hypothetical protein [Chryseobacterium nakagawai]AZA92626.1 hypothetical protein EG343_19490 [Chryseobacterium nakagawai]VEH19223.1 Uncharacterised protein [Chryseobacterium nakagawai]